eukprot:NODE_9170_length_328_cov_90.032258_g7406_i0.p2 GENE.NODE_9170_length_328_cov_90.032258_g7406_i0~~NODE_9170_length_328_cov_90.032258_g7406_i0.p2  ORF type:complete len:83 (-),score=61.00 NODE_9170_length_328_cov_90.032258_g7406_i0:80-307(-)
MGHEEAIALLENSERTAQNNINSTMEDLAFLRDQLTTSEVNIARVYNHEVKLKRKLKDEEAAKGGAATTTSSSSS